MKAVITILTFFCCYAPALEVHVDKYSLVISDGYGWKVVNAPSEVKKQGSSCLVMKDGGMKSIMLLICPAKDDGLDEMTNAFIRGMNKKGKLNVTAQSIAKIGEKDVAVVEFNGKNPDGDDIFGVSILTSDKGKALSFTLYSGFVNPWGDEEMLTIVSTVLNSLEK
jgi:hypothetical protein